MQYMIDVLDLLLYLIVLGCVWMESLGGEERGGFSFYF